MRTSREDNENNTRAQEGAQVGEHMHKALSSILSIACPKPPRAEQVMTSKRINVRVWGSNTVEGQGFLPCTQPIWV